MNQFFSFPKPLQAAMTFLSVFMASATQGSAQELNREFPSLRKEYANIARLSASSQPQRAGLDSITFPIEKMNKAFYRALKLRAVYLDVPLDSFRLPNFPANSSEQTRAELNYLLDLQSKRT